MVLLRVLVCVIYLLGGAHGYACPNTDEWRFTHWMDESAPTADSIGAVNALAQDKQGIIWVGGENGLARFTADQFKVFRHSVNDAKSISNSYVSSIVNGAADQLWIGTNGGLNSYDMRTDTFIRYDSRNGRLLNDNILSLAYGDGHVWIGTLEGFWFLKVGSDRAQEVTALRGLTVYTLHLTEGGAIWLGTSKGLAKWQINSGQLDWFGDRELSVRALAEDNRGNLWVGTLNQSLFRFTPAEAQWRQYTLADGVEGQTIRALEFNHRNELWVASEKGGVSRYEPSRDQFITSTWLANKPASLGSNKAKALKTDALGDLWVGLFPNGLDHGSRFANQFCVVQNASDASGLSHKSVLSLMAHPDANNIWIGTENGLNHYTANSKQFTQYIPAPGDTNQLQSGPILALAKGESNDELWLSAWGSGIYNFNLKTRQFTQIAAQPSRPDGLKTSEIWAMLRAHDGTLYLGGSGGGLQIYRGNGRFEHFAVEPGNPASISNNYLRSLLQTRSGRIFVGTASGLDEFLPDKKQFVRWLRNEQGEFKIGATVMALFEGRDGTLWVGTHGAGLISIDLKSKTNRVYALEDGLPSDVVSTINQDAAGVIWVGTMAGIARLINGRFETIDKSLGPAGNNYNRNASLALPNGKLWFGSVQGLTYFDPQSIMSEAAIPAQVHLGALRLVNKSQPIGSRLLPQALDYLSEVALDGSNPMLAIDFYAPNYRAPQLNRFAYRLVGIDEDFVDIGNEHTATYTHLPPGIYKFQVKAADSLGQWHPELKELRIVIMPQWWRTYWAMAVYIGFAGLIIMACWRFQQKRWELNRAQALNESLRHLDQLKDTFLANTSHELRTPLNGIIGLTEALCDGAQGTLNEGVIKTLQIISSSGRRLSYLINDILDFSKLSKKQLQLYLRPVELKSVVDGVVELVQPLVGDKPIALANEVSADFPCVLADPNRLQQILLNLIGNAVKFTQVGRVSVCAELIDQRLEIHVKDSGIGIDPKDFDAIFMEFSQVDSSDVRSQGGTGLGLAIAKHLVNLHGGQLKVSSQMGQGADFYFALQTTSAREDKSLAAQEHSNSPFAPVHAPLAEIKSDRANTILFPKDVIGQFTILVVDDDPVNRMVLASIIKLHQHRIIEANSGEQALDIVAKDKTIDMVILDVMMPNMSGFETAMRIRVAHPVHLLPIIFLTAKNYSDDLVRGFVAGGNDFLTKPVSKQELLSRITCHLRLLHINRSLEENIKYRDFEYCSTQAELQALDKIIASLNSEMNPAVLLKTLLNQILMLVDHADGASVWQLNDARSWICSAALALGHKYLGEQCFIVGDDLVNYLTELGHSHQPIHALGELKDTPLLPLYEFFEAPENTLIAVAATENQLVGIIALSYSGASPKIDEHLINAIHRIKSHATSVLLKAKMMQPDSDLT